MNTGMMDISNCSPEQFMRILYENAKWNREISGENGTIESEYFWSGTLNGIYATLENLGIKYDWLQGRDKDFNEYYKSK
ncbi:hypothetical protein [Paenibacillus cremeus]|uniref:Uncharacterized protein n=1 Tax=Paenibacillus cremeus TaxID=2163881 RepID=A0A559KCH8_9BACL|nr:hypothetical protein [Paenibacillus cremeus]TVY09831.1 hypothetical protein FPZ49_10675 [Paenibacillus cremeus]